MSGRAARSASDLLLSFPPIALAPWAALAAVGLLVLTAATPGPDAARYLDWGRALVQRDPGLIAGRTLSPAGFPVSHWSPGTGLFFAVPHFFAGSVADEITSLRVMAAAAALVLIVVIALVASRLFGGERAFVALTLGLTFGGTNLGYYTLHASSELVALLCVTATTLLLRVEPGRRGASILLLGSSAAILLLTRPQAAPLLLPAGALLWADAPGPDSARWARRRSVIGVGSLAAVGLAFVCLVNYWMTRSPWRSAHWYGDDTFQSIRLAPRYLGRVLFSDGAGLLPFHFVSLLGVVAASVVTLWPRGASRRERAYHAALVVACILQVWVLSGYYAWSGGWSIGSRYFLPLAVLLVFPVLERIADHRSTPVGFAWLLLLAVALSGLRNALSLVPIVTLYVVLGAAAVVQVATRRLRSGGGADSSTPLGEAALLLGNALSLSYLTLMEPRGLPAVLAVAAGALFLLSTCVRPPSLPIARTAPPAPSPRSDRLLGVASACAAGLLALFVGSLVRFLPVAEAYRARQLLGPDTRYAYVATFDIENLEDDVTKASEAYGMSPLEIRQMREFLERAKADGTRLRASLSQARRPGAGA